MKKTNYLGKEINLCQTTELLGGSFYADLTIYDEDKLQAFYELLKERQCKTLLDIGASTGSYSLLPLVLPGLQVWSFEPCVRTFTALALNMVFNDLPKNRLRMIAMSDYVGDGILHEVINDRTKALSMVNGKPASHKICEDRRVIIDTIDNFCTFNSIEPGAIKIDVEGNELAVLSGAEKIIRKYHPVIQCEYSQENANQYGYNVESIKHLLMCYDYDVSIEGADLIAK